MCDKWYIYSKKIRTEIPELPICQFYLFDKVLMFAINADWVVSKPSKTKTM